jgi:DNA (cytosine-5)-methyltransferase 1
VIAVSLFSGCGGLDYGMEAAGFQVAYRNDIDRHCCATLLLNGLSPAQLAPVEEVSASDIRGFLGSKTGVDLVMGGPPCQPFSKSAYWSHGDTLRLNDPRANTLAEFFRIVEELRPKAFLLENVHGISYTGKEEGFRFLIKSIAKINRKTGTDYNPSWRILNAADYGVPQLRQRFFLIAFRSGNAFAFPPPTHFDIERPGPPFSQSRSPYATAWDALAGLRPDPHEKLAVGGKWSGLLPSIPEGENYLWHTDRKGGLPLFGWRTRYWCFLLKLAKNKPSWTIQAQPGSAIGPFHWESRKLSWREMAAIQTFPREFRIEGPRPEIQRQIGNAVPSLLAEVLGRALMEQMSGKLKEGPKLSVKPIGGVPPAERPQPVPDEYLRLAGYHPPHPGTGQGRSYQRNL